MMFTWFFFRLLWYPYLTFKALPVFARPQHDPVSVCFYVYNVLFFNMFDIFFLFYMLPYITISSLIIENIFFSSHPISLSHHLIIVNMCIDILVHRGYLFRYFTRFESVLECRVCHAEEWQRIHAQKRCLDLLLG